MYMYYYYFINMI